MCEIIIVIIVIISWSGIVLQQSSEALTRDWSSVERPFMLPMTTNPVVPQTGEVMKLYTYVRQKMYV